jgi:hypothetical protein
MALTSLCGKPSQPECEPACGRYSSRMIPPRSGPRLVLAAVYDSWPDRGIRQCEDCTPGWELAGVDGRDCLALASHIIYDRAPHLRKAKMRRRAFLAAHTHGFSSALTLVHRDNPSHPRLGRCARAVGRCSNAEGRAKRKCESAARLYGSGRDRRCPAWRGRFISVACGSHVYHNVGDRWPKAIDASTMARYARAFANGALELARQTR